jgi:hypothetical protein
MAKVNAWMVHLKKFRAAHRGMNNKLIFSAAKKTYKKQSGHRHRHGGGALGGSLTPSDISGTTALQGKASLYSGGKRCSRRRHSSRRRSSKRQ